MATARIVYRYKNGLYVNFTNRCPTACSFCIKRSCGMLYRGLDLRLRRRDPDVEQTVQAVRRAFRRKPAREVVFCGYGEPTCRMDDLLAVCDGLRRWEERPSLRLNTVGLADLLCGRPAAPLLRGRIDEIRVSLNTADPAQWLELMRPKPSLRERGFEAVRGFIRSCAREGIKTTVTAVALPAVDLKACRRLALSLGARFAVRPLLRIKPRGAMRASSPP